MSTTNARQTADWITVATDPSPGAVLTTVLGMIAGAFIIGGAIGTAVGAIVTRGQKS